MRPDDVTQLNLLPMDEHNRKLVENVHPSGWPNPTPDGRYNLVVIGAGTAGLVTAAIAASLGAKVALVERHLMGGDCLNVGCVPSKGIISAARIWQALRRAPEYGISPGADSVQSFSAVMERMRRLRADISHVDSARRFKDMGVDVYIGEGVFVDRGTVAVEGARLRFSKAVIATGARAVALPIPGLREAGFLTNETVFSLTELPRRLGVIGAGPIGCEMAQSFARFGSEVSVFEQYCRILPREDEDAGALVANSMRRDGVRFVCDAKITRISTSDHGKVIHYSRDDEAGELVVDDILVGIGRAPNVDGMGLGNAGVEYDVGSGVKVDKHLRTTNRRVFSAGDVCSPLKFTHTADAMAQIVIQNALFPHPFGLGYASTDNLVIPWCTYTSPEVAHVGLYASQAQDAGVEVETFTVALSDVDRAVLDGETDGFARVHLKMGSDRILGATIVAAHAGDLISQFTLAIKNGLGLGSLGGMIYPYPTQAEVIRKVANTWRKTVLTDRKKRLLGKLFAWMR